MENVIKTAKRMGRGNGAWHAEAKQMRAEGQSYAKIAKHFDVSSTAVYFLFNPSKRQKKKVTESEKAFDPIAAPISAGG